MEQAPWAMAPSVKEAGQEMAGAGADAETAAEKITDLPIIGQMIPIVGNGIIAARMMRQF
ncbi:hypothetical protein Awo_c31860 [Acetobacterium woodii DSM 1030]|uniref:Uncharacterized protein n=1 Tax=Acetobacterium woodii (strain ATCC 29683 / DSM 1030 / JCM 2381 / KCTC 1655 / WB1) TaxID=931626 RepID=H6LJI6_ACEWD|nr:hypothetical protein Awo_c31860 [Acetobacterium woodii DSM 1030]